MNIQRGMRDKLDKYVQTDREFTVSMSVVGSNTYDYCCFGVDAAGKLSDDRYMVFYNQTRSPGGEIRYAPTPQGADFAVTPNRLPLSVDKLVFTVSIDGNGVMGAISAHTFDILQDGKTALHIQLSGQDFRDETAIITVELYRRNGWRFAAVARGFNGGLGDLLRSYGGEEATPPKPEPVATPPKPQPVPIPAPADSPTKPQPVRIPPPPKVEPPKPEPAPIPEPPKPEPPKKVILKKGEKVSLRKKGKTLGEVLINLNWSQPKPRMGLFGPRNNAIDLDLGCLYELKDGRKGCVQALGNVFGSFDAAPYVALDGDDRTGASVSGENLRVNGNHIREIKRILVYTFIYDGVANWREADGVVTVQCPGSQEIVVRMDEYGSSLGMCAIALLENDGDETFSVKKLIEFYRGHSQMDAAFHWGLRWVAGRKD